MTVLAVTGGILALLMPAALALRLHAEARQSRLRPVAVRMPRRSR